MATMYFRKKRWVLLRHSKINNNKNIIIKASCHDNKIKSSNHWENHIQRENKAIHSDERIATKNRKMFMRHSVEVIGEILGNREIAF